MKSIFSQHQQELAEIILENNHLSRFSELYSTEVKELAIIWSFYSAKIEGNAYTFVEVQTLLKDGITSSKRYDDAVMLENLYNTFFAEAKYIKEGNIINIDKNTIFRLHSYLTDDLIEDKNRGVIRNLPVMIRGTHYVPSSNPFEIDTKLNEIIETFKLLSNPLEKAVYLHCNMAKLQPFIDGNKRTSRLLESIVLMNSDIIPIFTTNLDDIESYRRSLLHFYETDDYSQYSEYFLNQKLTYLQQFAKQDLTKGNK